MKSIDINGTRLCYSVSGNPANPPLVLMHGWGCTSATVASIERTAAETHCVYNVDFPGFGASPDPATVWGVEEYTQAIEALVDAEKIENPVLIGHSFGGRVGILYASRRPVSKLILVDAAGLKPRRGLKYYYKVYSYKLWKRLIRLTCSRDKVDKIIRERQSKAGSADYRALNPHMRRIFVKVVNEYLRDRLPLIKAPTLLVWGEADTATPMRDAKIMEREIPDAGLVSFPGAGHYSFLDRPTQFAAVLRSFLKS